MKMEPYLFLNGRAEEAVAFYAQALGATSEKMLRYADSPHPEAPEHMPPGGPQKVLHASLRLGDQRLMLSDGIPRGGPGFRGFSLTLQYDRIEDAERAHGALVDGGETIMAPGPTFFAAWYAMLEDRFGVQWMILVHDDGLEPGTPPVA